MIGLIISGHGNFGTGLKSSLKLIAGDAQNTEFIDFLEDDSTETLKEKYKVAINNLHHCESILALCDLAGGSPFKTLVELKMESSKPMEVIGGTNLPMALEVLMGKDIFDDLEMLTNTALDSGKGSIVKFEFIVHEDNEDEGGI